MHAECVVAEYQSDEAVRVALDVLQSFDFAADAVSVVTCGHEDALDQIDNSDEHSRDIEKSAGIGAAIDALFGSPLSIATIMGPIMLFGPLVAIAAGAAAGGLFGATEHIGMHEHTAKDYEQRVKNGSTLIIVTSTPTRTDEAQRALKTTWPESLERFARRHDDESTAD